MSMILVIAASAFAQMKKDRTSAYSYWNKAVTNDEPKHLIKAKEFIDKAVAYPEAESDAKVWYYKGVIYLDIAKSEAIKLMFPNTLEPALEAFQKAMKLDVKEEFKTDITVRMTHIGVELFSEGRGLFTAQKYDEALVLFDKAIATNKEVGITDTISMYGAALCHYSKQDWVKAEEAYGNLVAMNFNEPDVYSSLATALAQNKKEKEAELVIDKGLQLYPDNSDLSITKANMLMASGKYAESISILNGLKAKFPGNTSIIYAIGVVYDQMRGGSELTEATKEEYFNTAITTYKEVLEIDSSYFDALFNIGVMYYNKGGDLINDANKLPFSETVKFDQLMALGNENLNKALPYFEHAERIKPDDTVLLSSLKEIYTRLKMYDKMKAINEKLGK